MSTGSMGYGRVYVQPVAFMQRYWPVISRANADDAAANVDHRLQILIAVKAADQLGALGLAINVIVLWNTLYTDAALAQLRAEGLQVRDEDVARLSPLGFEHINMLGRYAFILPDTIARGELRPLRDPASASTENEEPALT